MALKIDTVPSREAFIEEATSRIDAYGVECIEARGRAVIALSGGSTPREINRLWKGNSRLDWEKVVLLYGDERCVPPDHEDSNAGAYLFPVYSGISPRVQDQQQRRCPPGCTRQNSESIWCRLRLP